MTRSKSIPTGAVCDVCHKSEAVRWITGTFLYVCRACRRKP